ncbi:LTA synthase family protein [Bacillus thermotolerans]|uniref:Lipoteichoic acid synthase LtaS Type Ia n=1 Tax=Bacillus thermotolerans TaxID=1221996 RepID=A0A0F5HN62_BACTR|nr:LTA synthase family protein [Bacillus thermotolerans]KKB34491.1 Lipoteichoic acid synthase LtaS Type Ia [Bacillus thermotolerans]KKB34688.1 Lipoteichoic acid synthase LtaS Type Ia [Bacillus thermotolerans]
MEKLLNTSKYLLNKPLGLFFLIVVVFWLKTYVIYQIEFSLGIQNTLQQFLLFINPISSTIFFLAFALLFKGKGRFVAYLTIQFLLSFLLYANVVYYRFFNDFITMPVLLQTQNFGQLGGSVLALLKPYDILYFLDLILITVLVLIKAVKLQERVPRKTIAMVFSSAVLIFAANLALAETDRPQLLTRTFDRNYLVKYLGVHNFTIYDIIQSTTSASQRALADSDDITKVKNYTDASYVKPNKEYFGAAKDMNVLYIQMESLQDFIIDYKLNGQEVTPFLNSLTRDKNTLYFNNFFHQTGQGKTSDAEFLIENSMFPLPKGSVYVTKATNTYQGLPAVLKSNGFKFAATLHGNYKTFWNRENMYKALGYDMFYDATYYNMAPENTLNYGLEDKPFFKESIPYLKDMPQPFFAKLITLSNHFPYPLDEEDQTIEPATTGDKTVDGYFQTARYFDEALKQFFDDLKASGLYDNTMIVMYGDHYGISENRQPAMEKVLGKEITPFDQQQLQRVPLLIHIPGEKIKGGVNPTYGGQVDLRPTVLRLLGIDTKEYIEFGTDLVSSERRQIVPFRNGDFVTPELSSVDGKLYKNPTGERIMDNAASQEYTDLVKKRLELSDKVIYRDLLRFHQPKGFTPVDQSTLDYSQGKHYNNQ